VSELTGILSFLVDLLVFLLFAAMVASVLTLALGPVVVGSLDLARRVRSRLRWRWRRSPR